MMITSAPRAAAVSAVSSWAAVSMVTTSTPTGGAIALGPSSSVTAAPRRWAAAASAAPHLARAAVPDEPRRIDRLIRRPGGHDDALAREILRRQHVRRGLDDIGRLGEPPRAGPPARQEAVARTDHAIAGDRDEARDVCPGERVIPHVHVHRRREQHRRAGREHDRGDRVVGLARRQPRQRARRGRRDHDQVGLIGELDMPDRRLLGEAEQIGEHRPAGQRLEGHRPDELLRPRGHRDVDLRARLVQQPHQLGGLVRGDAAGDPDDDARVLQGVCGITGRSFAARSIGHEASLACTGAAWAVSAHFDTAISIRTS